MPTSTSYTMVRVGRARSPKQDARRVAGGTSSNWPTRWPAFAGSDRGGERAAVVDSLIATAKLNDVDLRTRLAADHPNRRLDEFLPWH